MDAGAAIPSAMKDRVVFSLLAAVVVVVVSLAAVWPQGYGARSPGFFGHIPIQQTPGMRAAMAREAEALARRRQTPVNAAAVAAGLRTTR